MTNYILYSRLGLFDYVLMIVHYVMTIPYDAMIIVHYIMMILYNVMIIVHYVMMIL